MGVASFRFGSFLKRFSDRSRWSADSSLPSYFLQPILIYSLQKDGVELTEYARQLSFGKMLGDAAMVAISVTQGVLLGPLAVHVELVGVLEDVLVAVG